jgi:hypothetical protein
VTIPQFAQGIVASGDVELRTARKAAFRKTLERCLRLDALRVTAKALSVYSEYPQTLHGARLITDIRPIFLESPSKEAAGAMVVHTLRIAGHGGHSGTDTTDYFVAMGSSGLDQLDALIARARQKETGLKKSMGKAGIPIVEMGSE